MRYSLRSVFVLVTCATVFAALLHYATKDYRERMALQDHLLSIGACFAHIRSDGTALVVVNEPIVSRRLAGQHEIEALELKFLPITPQTVENLAGLGHLDWMLFQSCTLEGDTALAALKSVGEIGTLIFWNTDIGDSSVDQIAQVPGLKSVRFRNTEITQAGLERLRAAVPGVEVREGP